MRRWLILFIMLLIFALLVFQIRQPVQRLDIIREDVRSRYPNAEVVEVYPGEGDRIKVRVAGNLSSYCPFLLYLYYDKKTNLPEKPDWIVRNCKFERDVPPILYAEEAVTLSHLYLSRKAIEHEPPANVSEIRGGWQVCWHDVCTRVRHNGDVSPIKK